MSKNIAKSFFWRATFLTHTVQWRCHWSNALTAGCHYTRHIYTREQYREYEGTSCDIRAPRWGSNRRPPSSSTRAISESAPRLAVMENFRIWCWLRLRLLIPKYKLSQELITFNKFGWLPRYAYLWKWKSVWHMPKLCCTKKVPLTDSPP